MKQTEPAGAKLLSCLPEELEETLESMSQPKFRSRQLFEWIHKRGIFDPAEMTNLPKSLRESLVELELKWPARIGRVFQSIDLTRKLEVLLEDGRSVETVLIPEEGKLTQCISSQVGCAVRCRFCRSGQKGLSRNLTASEIASQVQLARPYYLPGERLRNVVVMGIGEPLHNLAAVVRAISLLSHRNGLDLSTRRITISTVGIAKGIDRLAESTASSAALAVSLHAADDDTRSMLVPGIKDKLSDIIEALSRFPLPKRRRFTIEYVLVKDVNDDVRDAVLLAKLLSKLQVKINLLPLNPHDQTDLMPPEENRVIAFQDILLKKGFSTFLRRRRGAEIDAACGQLLAQ